ncbi:MAG: membrane oxidoreductase [Rhodospirillales bacterium]|nr:membrane oxidoreductase [Rhodospirillales bacterium]
MEIKNSFTVSSDIKTSWNILLDIERIAPCMPGAELTAVIDDTHYKGNAKLRVGPVSLTFSGEAEITEVDEVNFSAKVHAKGNDTKGRGAADANVVFVLSEDGDKTRVDVLTELNLSGSVAQYGRASGLIDAIASQIISDFTDNLEAEITNEKTLSTEIKKSTDTNQSGVSKKSDNSISGLSLFFRAIWAMILGKR